MPASFSKINASVAGKLEDVDKMPGWIRHHGVQIAKKLGTVNIVQPAWLYDSFQSKTPAPEMPSNIFGRLFWKRRAPRKRPKMEPENRRKPRPQAKPPKIKDPFVQDRVLKKRAARSSKQALPKNQLYTDMDTKECWDVSMTRFGPSLKREKFRLGIFQSTQDPSIYSAYAKYTRLGIVEISILAPPPSTLDFAQMAFKNFFLLQTGVEWEDRFNQDAWDNRSKRGSLSPSPTKNDQGKQIPAHQGWYTLQTGSIMSAYMKQSSLPQPASEVAHAQVKLVDEARSDEDTTGQKGNPPGENGKDSGDDGDNESSRSCSASSMVENMLDEGLNHGNGKCHTDLPKLAQYGTFTGYSSPRKEYCDDTVEFYKRNAMALLESTLSDDSGGPCDVMDLLRESNG
ncbi:hypothetical protein N7454_004352 [Penicillium verhagenii]|nr:hypothetical protein N7454_004352 [Penicillium verhagenii]